MKRAVQFGAGNIGRGFMGQLYWETGFKTVFVEARKEIVALLNDRGEYPLKLLDAYKKREIDLSIDNLSAIQADDLIKISSEISRADVISTAVGVGVLGAISTGIADGIKKRAIDNPKSIDIYLCENTLDAPSILKDFVYKKLDRKTRDWADKNVGFVGMIVARMVPQSSTGFGIDDPLFVVADAYHRLSYDGKATRSDKIGIEGIYPVKNFTAEFERKLFTYNLGHAVLGYLGYLRNYNYVHETFDDSLIRSIFDGALDETSKALSKKYPEDINMSQQKEVRVDVVTRFGNPLLKDTIVRVARDPIRKLSMQDRIIGSLNLCLDYGIFPENIIKVCAAAYNFDYKEDSVAIRLQEMIKKQGIGQTIREVSDIDADSDAGKKIIKYFFEFKDKRKE